MDPDSAKSKTLLYFFEHLVYKGEPQKLVHLSRLFDSKNFTKDMSDVVEGSLAGLKKLLVEHPSLFTIDDDENVVINTYESDSTGVSARDYKLETKEFFKHKLLSYGIGVEVPIDCLHGHRSQAPDCVRHVSGTKPRQLKEFLSQHPQTFRIVGKNVLLLGAEGVVNNVPSSSTSSRLFKVEKQGNNDFPNYRVCKLLSTVKAATANNNDTKFDSKEPAAYFSGANGESNGYDSDFDVKLEDLCEHNCPKLSDISNVFSLEQLQTVGNTKTNHKNAQVISTVADSILLTDIILESIANTDYQAVFSFNCVAVRLGEQKKKKLSLIKLGTPCGKAFFFDVLSCPQIMTDGGLKAVLESDRVVKVIHDCRQKSLILFEQFNTILKCVFDTQSASAVLFYQKNGLPVSQANMMSFQQLIELYCPMNPMIDQFLQYKQTSRLDDQQFTEETIVFDACGVLLLMQLYGSMALLIKEENKPMFSNLCTENIYALIHPRAVKALQMQRKISYEIADLKRKLAEPTKNIVLSRRQIHNLRYMDLTEDEKEKILVTPQLIKKLERFGENNSGLSASESGFAARGSVFTPSPEQFNQGTSTDRCCVCKSDQESQTLSTGDIVIKQAVFDD